MRNFVFFSVICAALLSGCNSLRFSPSEPIKQTAELTNDLATKIDREGTDPGSSASKQLVRGTQVALSYIGRSDQPADPDDFETIVSQGQIDAELRPDVWQVADAALELGIGVAGLFGGIGGIKLAGYFQKAKEKSKALQEVVKGNELFKKTVDQGIRKQFADAQNQTQSTNSTKRIVSEIKQPG